MTPHNPFGGILWSQNRISTKEGKQCQARQNEVQKKYAFSQYSMIWIFRAFVDRLSILSDFRSFLDQN